MPITANSNVNLVTYYKIVSSVNGALVVSMSLKSFKWDVNGVVNKLIKSELFLNVCLRYLLSSNNKGW